MTTAAVVYPAAVRAIVLAVVAAASCALAAGATASRPFRTAVDDPFAFATASPAPAFARVAAAGAAYVRLHVDWETVAPAGATKPAGFRADDPEDPAYRWARLDAQVRAAEAAGLQPIVTVSGAPRWARRGRDDGLGPNNPNPVEYGLFARALARRYSGASSDLPRVRYWQAWNEPNITSFLLPQFDGGHRPVSPDLYRALVNAFSDAVHGAAAGNVVVAGGLSPFSVNYKTVKSVGPMTFMRQLFCLGPGSNARSTCSTPIRFDVWAHHPYTSGGPFHHASNPDDVSLGDLPEMRALLNTALRAHRIVAPHGLGFWVTEFGWDTNPPDARGVPLALHARWTAEALYQMWRSGVTVATWWLLQDQPYPSSPYQSGLYVRAPRGAAPQAKPSLAAFRFPFVAYRRTSGVYVWGRTPSGAAATVVLQRRRDKAGGWTNVGSVRADRFGLFARTVRVPARQTDFFRAKLVGPGGTSLPFALSEPPDRQYRPFG